MANITAETIATQAEIIATLEMLLNPEYDGDFMRECVERACQNTASPRAFEDDKIVEAADEKMLKRMAVMAIPLVEALIDDKDRAIYKEIIGQRI